MKPVVSVCMITYNHEKYIAQAIESVLKQKTSFLFELVLGDDFSTDNTRKICIDYRDKYPDIIKLRLPDKNIGMLPNFVENLKSCHGKYIALIEGDDFWIDPLKLQKQVDFMEINNDFAICFHAIKILNENKPDKTPKIHNTELREVKVKDISTIEDLCLGNYIYTATCLFRNYLFKEIPIWYFGCPFGDWPLHLLNAEHGKIKYLIEPMAVYRIHSGGAWSKLNSINLELKTLKTINICAKNFNKKYFQIFMRGAIPKYIRLIKLYRKKNILKAVYFTLQLWVIRKYNTFAISKTVLIKILIQG